MTTPLISVIIPVRNAAKYLNAAIDSVLAQTYRPIEVICINDGSTDATGSILSGYGDRIRVIENTKPTGVSAARNRGIAVATGEWIAFLDADDVWDPDKLAVQLNKGETEADIIHSNARIIDEKGAIQKESMQEGPKIANLTFVDLLEGNWLFLLTVMVRRTAINAVGGFNTKCPPAEDWALWLSLAAAGYRFRYVNAILGSYRRHGENASSNEDRMLQAELNVYNEIHNKYPTVFGRREGWIYHEHISRLHARLAINKSHQKKIGQGLFHYILSIAYKPHSLNAWVNQLAHGSKQ